MVKSVDMRNSRYVHGGNSYNTETGLGWWDRITISPADDDIFVTLNSAYVQSPWLVSYDLYGDPTLLWVILQSNNILNIDEEFIEGVVVRVPSKVRLMTSILIRTPGGINEK